MCIRASQRMLWFVLSAGLSACGADLTLPADGSPSNPSNLRAVSGGGQEATVGSELPKPLIVQLTDGAARPIAGISLAFSFQADVPAAKVNPSIIATDDTGFAVVQVRLGTRTGPQTIQARLTDPTSNLSATFAVTALPKKDNKGDGGKGKDGGKGHGGGHDDDDD